MTKRANTQIVKAVPLGGHGEIGKNCWLFEYNDAIIIVNFGFMLPQQDAAGIDLVLPNTNYLKENESKIKGLILTSAHDDSAGGVFYLLQKVNIPKIWGSKLALTWIENTLPKNLKMPEKEELKARSEFTIQEGFTITPFCNTSTLMDTYGLSIRTPAGNIIYTGPYKIDQTPPDKVCFDCFSYAQAGESGVDLLISDSTNLENRGYTQTEKAITKRFDDILREAPSRIIIVGYASNLHKYQIIFNLAKKHNKKVLLVGEHLIHKIQAGVKADFIKIEKGILIDKKDSKAIKDSELVIIASGKHGNFLNALTELAKQTHKEIELKQKDTIVISANPPHGTVRTIAHIIDQFFIQKVQVIGGRGQGVHVPGHASQEEMKFMLNITKPRAFVPSIGEERHMVLAEQFAEIMGISANDIHIIKKGEVIEIRDKTARVAGRIPAESIYYNLAKNIDIDEVTMKERQTLAEEGTITVALTLDQDRNIIAGPEIFADGCSFAKGKDWRAFCLGAIEQIKVTIDEANKEKDKEEKDLATYKTLVRDTVNKNVLELISKRPLISVSIQEANLATSNKQ